MTTILTITTITFLFLFLRASYLFQVTHDKYMGSLDKFDRLRSKTGYYGDVYNTKDS